MQTRDWLIPLATLLLGGGAAASIRSLWTVGPERGRTLAEEESLAVTSLKEALVQLRADRADDRQRLLDLADELTRTRGQLRTALDENDRLKAVLRAWERKREEEASG
jgi:hypothetical protein